MLTIQLLLTATSWLVMAPFSALPLEGEPVRGEITALDTRQLVLETEKGPVSFALDKLATVSRPADDRSSDKRPATSDAAAAQAGLWVQLHDGSGLPAAEYSVKKGRAKVVGSAGGVREIRAGKIRSVRLAPELASEPKLAKQWAEITASKAAGDLLVVRKNEALDYLEGVIRDLDDETCQFELDGELIPVKRTKIAGLVYARPAGSELAEPVGVVMTSDGTKLQLKSLELAGDLLRVETTGGTNLELSLADVNRFDFSSGKIAYLSDLDPDSAEFTPQIGFAQPPEGVLAFFAYRRDLGFEQQPLKLDGKEFPKGLALASRTQLVYRLPGKFRLFRATAGIDDATRETGSVRLEIKGDGAMLWEGEIRGDEPAQDLELEISGVKRLEILADYGAGLDVGDRLDLGNAQVTK